ncbi:MAG: VCBS repeat-containing protein [Chlorobi bacterium]|nr:VCBS repeat-containing protein [Chlorobiota bacterium]
MKKNYLFINGATKWNSLVYKFYKLYKRMRLLNLTDKLTEREYSRLREKMQKLYKRLEKMQYKVGIRIAGTVLAIILSASTAKSQDFASQDTLKGISKDIDVSFNSTPVFADLDGDGDADMYVGNKYGEVIHYENDGNGVYTMIDSLQVDGANINLGSYATPVFADLDNDGDLDLYLGTVNGKIGVYQNNGNGVFTSAGFLQADSADIGVSGTTKFTFADLDGDNDLDLFIGDYYDGGFGNKYGYIKYYKNDGGVFTANGNLQANGSDIHINSSSNPNLSPAFADIDDDGDLDLYIASNNRNILYYENDGTGILSAGVNMQADGIDINILNSYPSITFADINGDGAKDLFIGEQDGIIEYYKNDGAGTFSTESYFQELLTSNIHNRFMSPAFADIDGNGILDLYAGTFRNHLLYYENDGNMLFGFHSNVKDSILGDQLSPAFADIDGDGNLDLYIGSPDGHIKYYKNDGSGTYTFQENLQAGGSDISIGYPVSPVFADIDDDGDLDLFVGDYSGNITFMKITEAVYFHQEL